MQELWGASCSSLFISVLITRHLLVRFFASQVHSDQRPTIIQAQELRDTTLLCPGECLRILVFFIAYVRKIAQFLPKVIATTARNSCQACLSHHYASLHTASQSQVKLSYFIVRALHRTTFRRDVRTSKQILPCSSRQLYE